MLEMKKVYREFNFISFANILDDIRIEFLTEVEHLGLLDNINLKSRIIKRILKHSVLIEVLKSYKYVVLSKINVIYIEKHKINIFSGGLFDESLFLKEIFKILDNTKRKIPILIKNAENTCDFEDFLETGEGISFLNEIRLDRERLRLNSYSFRAFKEFSKKNGLDFILKDIEKDQKFKKLFIS